jgi:hypothetical protein
LETANQLECWIDGRWRPAVRYDTAHGGAHRDVLDWFGRVVRKDWMPTEVDYNDALRQAEADVIGRAEAYRAEFLRRKP